MYFKIFENQEKIFVRFKYSPAILRDIKSIGTGSWNKEKRAWCFRNTAKNKQELMKLKEKYAPEEEKTYDDQMDSSEEAEERDLIEALKLKGYSRKTIKAYLGHFKRFMKYIDFDESRINRGLIKEYCLYLLDVRECSHSYVNQGINAIKFYLRYVKEKRIGPIDISRPKKEKRLPQVLSAKEIKQILDAPSNIKHRMMLMLTYSAGLRVSEVSNLKIEKNSARKDAHQSPSGQGT